MSITKDSVHGIMPPMITPFSPDESLDIDAFRREAEYLLGFDVKALVVGGSTGEGATLTAEELVELCETAVAESKGKVPIIAGIIVDSTREAIQRGKLVSEVGVGGLMVTPVHYLEPSDEGIYEFYHRIGSEIGLPFIIYNVVRQVAVSPALLERLVTIPQLVAIKESAAGDLITLTQMIETVGHQISVSWAWDQILFPGLVIGASGSISGINTILPGLSVELFNAVQAGDLQRSRQLHFRMYQVSRHLTHPNWHSRVKASINLQGRNAGIARSPSVPLTATELDFIREGLVGAGVLASSC